MPQPIAGLVIAAEWKNTLSRKQFDSKITKPPSITIFGSPTAFAFQTGLTPELMTVTRHHVIPHGLLIDVWERAVLCGDMDLIKAMAVWAGKNPAVDLPATFADSLPNPQTVLRKIAWNPFNIVIGPLSEHRVEDPGSNFDAFEFRALTPRNAVVPTTHGEKIKLQSESVARQEFNRHLGVLRRIYNIFKRYIEVTDQVAPQEVASLITLLRSDCPESYPALGPAYRTGALLSPDLWANYSTIQSAAPASQYAAISVKTAKFSPKKGPVIAPWAAETWLPEVDLVLPKADALDTTDDTVWAPGEANLPLDTLLLSSLALGAMDETTFRLAVVRAIRKPGKFKARAILCGPPGALSNMARWTASELKRLNREGYQIRISRKMFDSAVQEVRIYGLAP